MSNGAERVKDMLTAPMEAVIIALGVGIARAQRELDLHSIELQKEINEDPVLSEYGLQAQWYQIPKAELELNIAIAMEEKDGGTKAPALKSGFVKALEPYKLKQIHFQPVNATYTNQFDYNVQASSKLKISFSPVPPPVGDGAASPRMARDEVLKAANDYLTKPPANVSTRIATNFNPMGRLWFVLQYRVDEETLTRLALVVVDDETGKVVKNA
jgi:hypothetical protein